MRTLVYARYSSQMQNPRSIADQLAACRKRAADEGWEIVAEFSDQAISGAAGIDESQRPGLAAMLDRLDQGGIEQVLTEATDRIARHQGDAFQVRERIEYAGARLFTLFDGVVDDITGTIKGLMDARMRKDLAERVKRGQRGNVLEGRSSSGVAFGYRKVARFDAKGDAIRGLREIDPDKAEIVQRIFREYDGGDSPKAIASRLNAEAIPAPRGGLWRPSTIIGHRKTGFGILSNPVYIGQLVYGRSRSVVDPRTRNRTMRPGIDCAVTGEAPHLRIVDDALWARVQAQIAARSNPYPHRQRRPKHLLSGLGKCGVCGSNYIVTRRDYFGCSGFEGGGEGACTNRRLIKKDIFERRVLAELEAQLLDPAVVAAYLDEYRTEHAARARTAMAGRAKLETRLAAAGRKVDRLVAAIADGGGEFAEIREALAGAKAEREEARRALAEIEALPAIALHPGLARQYREAVANLAAEMADETTRREAAPKLRALIARVVVHPKPPPAKRGVDLEIIRHVDEALALADPTRKTA